VDQFKEFWSCLYRFCNKMKSIRGEHPLWTNGLYSFIQTGRLFIGTKAQREQFLMETPPGSFIVGLSLSYFYLLKEKENPEEEGDVWSPIYIGFISEEGKYKQKIIPVSSLRTKRLGHIMLDDYQLKYLVENHNSQTTLLSKDEVFHVNVIDQMDEINSLYESTDDRRSIEFSNYEITKETNLDMSISILQQELKMKEELIANLQSDNTNTEYELMALNSVMETERNAVDLRPKCLEVLYNLVAGGEHSNYITWEDFRNAESLFQNSDALLRIYEEYLITREETVFLTQAKTILRSAALSDQ